MAKTATQMVDDAKRRVENLSIDAAAAEIASGAALLLDIREADERDADGFIPGSVHVPRGLLEFRADPTHPSHQDGLEPSRRVILHCAGGGRSALAAIALQELGYTRVAHIDGGLRKWRASGRPVVLGAGRESPIPSA